MTFTRITARQVISLVCVATFVATLLVASSDSRATVSDLPAAPKVAPELLHASGKVRIYIALVSNELGNDMASRQSTRIVEQSRESAKARARAAANPYLFTDQERQAARSVERLRTRSLPGMRRAAAPDVAANELIASTIEHAGGKVHFASPLPNSLTATVPAKLISVLSRSSAVDSIMASGDAPHRMSSPVDGSETWHANGFTGNGTSADGFGGPDYAVIDAGVRTTHLAFRTRLPGDPTNGPATGPTRITSPSGRTDFTGSEHGNTVAATVASTDLTQSIWPDNKGLAYGIDKVYDPLQSQSSTHWLSGITYDGEPGVSDIPEAINYSSGFYENATDFNPSWIFIDNYIASLAVTYSISAGNCGIENGGFTNCAAPGQGPHRVSTPGNLHNTITVGGLDYNGDANNSTVWIPWPNTSPGPTWGGRKKPDLIFTTQNIGPNDNDDTTYENTGQGTSYAAPAASAGALLLASTGVHQPTAQKAILINGATPIQGQTYWTPKAGWGAINLDTAFHQRANYANATITDSSDNGVRFFRATGVTPGDRSTLVWNRRTATSNTYRALTNLDLSQHDEGTGSATSTGGSDVIDTVDTDQTITAANPMPGSGIDGGDNVEQVRSTASGTQVLKVKNQGAIDGLAVEPFSIASAKPLTALATPIPTVDLSTDLSVVQPGQPVTVTAELENPSAEIDLTAAQVTLALPGGVSLTSGTASQNLTLTAGDSDTAVWQVEGSSDGLKSLSASVSGAAFGETFNGNDSANITIDGTAPTATTSGPAPWSTDANVPFSWSGVDAIGVATYDVEVSRNGGAFEVLLADTTSTTTPVNGSEGESLTIRVVATDTAGNTSSPATHTSTIDAVPPQVSLSPSLPTSGTAIVAIDVSNIGAPVSATYFFGIGNGAQVPLLGTTVSYTNRAAIAQTATVSVTATDAIGRSVSASSSVRIPSAFLSPNLKITSTKVQNGRLVIRGSAASSAARRVSLLIERIGKQGTRRKRLTASLKRGKFNARIKLAPGRYRVTASLPRTSTYLAQKSTKRSRVK